MNTYSVLPRAARRKLSTAAASLPSHLQPTPPPQLTFEPRLLAIAPAPTQSSSSTATTPSSYSAHSNSHPRYTTYYAQSFSSIPPVFFIPSPVTQQSFVSTSSSTQQAEHTHKLGYSLELGAYGIPKRRRNNPADSSNGDDDGPHDNSHQPLQKTLPIQDPSSEYLAVQVGEDAYFLRPDALGVADGVGGWRHSKDGSKHSSNAPEQSNSAVFARKLMHYCSLEIEQRHQATPSTLHSTSSSPSQPTAPVSSSSTTPPPPDPVAILQHSYDRCINEAQQLGLGTGSSTALLAVLHESELRVAHLGDCSICLIRAGEMVFRSEEMQHSFNYPFQLGPRSTTTPTAHAQRFNIPVQPNDILILASDGMGDNLWDEDVLDEVHRFVNYAEKDPARGIHKSGKVTNGVLAQRLSEALASRAKRVSESSAQATDATSVFADSKRAAEKMRENQSNASQPISSTKRPASSGDSQLMANVQEAAQEEQDFDEEPEWLSDEIPFGRKAREAGLRFVGGKNDDISVLVAIISGGPIDPASSKPSLRMNLHR